MAFFPGRGGFGGPPRGGVGQGQIPMDPRFGGQGGPLPVMRGPMEGSFKKGGKVKKTGAYKLHKGEKVLTKAQQKKRGKKSDSNAFVAGRRA